jgi:recombination protein U
MSHANRGKAFEAAIEAQIAFYRLDGLASIDKNNPEWVLIGYDPATNTCDKCFPKRRGGVDYDGAIAYLGRAWPLYFDAKETHLKTRFPLDNIDPEQLEFLREKSRYGAIAFLLVHLAPLERVFLVDVEQVDRARAAGRSSLSLADLEAGIEVRMRAWRPDFLPPILSLLEKHHGQNA